MSAYCPDACPDADACVVGYPCKLFPNRKGLVAMNHIVGEQETVTLCGIPNRKDSTDLEELFCYKCVTEALLEHNNLVNTLVARNIDVTGL